MTNPQETAIGGEATLLTVRILDPQRVYADVPGRFVLLPVGDNATRLLVRESLAIPERASWTWVIWDPMHFAMERRMLQGIKERAEGSSAGLPTARPGGGPVGWALAGLGLLAVFLSRRAWWPWLVLPLAPGCPSCGSPDLNSALAAILAVGATVVGALACGWRWWPRPTCCSRPVWRFVLIWRPTALPRSVCCRARLNWRCRSARSPREHRWTIPSRSDVSSYRTCWA